MKLLQAVDEKAAELIRFTREIVKTPSYTGDEGAVAKIIYDTLSEFGLDDCWIDEIGNVIAVLKGQGNGPNVLLNSHMDVVPTGNLDQWTHDPFGAHLDESGAIFGRGTADMKGGLAALVFAMSIFASGKRKGVVFPGDIIFSSVVHEEAAEMFGMEHLCETSLPSRGLNFDVCFLAEPTNGRINLGHRGKVELVIQTLGKTAHSSRPWQGINALEKMLPILDFIFNEMGPGLPVHPELGQCSVTVTNCVCKPGALSITPDECEIYVDRRYTPSESIEDVIRDFESLITDLRQTVSKFDASVRVRTVLETSYTGLRKEVRKNHPVWMTAKDHPFVKQTQAALTRIGREVSTGYFIGGVDGAYTAGIMGVPTIGYSAADETLAHTTEERTDTETIISDTKAYVAILSELFGIDT